MSLLPAAIRVGPLKYRVLTDAGALAKAVAAADLSDGDGWAAFSDHRHLVIGLNPDEAPDAMRHSLLHELLHCSLRLSGAWPNAHAQDHTTSRRPSGVDVEEFAVATLAGPLLGVLQDNPALIAYLTEETPA